MAVANTIAYYDTATITAVKSFKVQAPLAWASKEDETAQRYRNDHICVALPKAAKAVVVTHIFGNKLCQFTRALIGMVSLLNSLVVT